MTVKEAILTLNGNALIACDRAGFSSATVKMIEDALDTINDALKEQEAVEPINSYGTFRCGNCGNIVGYNDGYGRGYQNNFCSNCGQAVKWND